MSITYFQLFFKNVYWENFLNKISFLERFYGGVLFLCFHMRASVFLTLISVRGQLCAEFRTHNPFPLELWGPGPADFHVRAAEQEASARQVLIPC